MKPWTLVWFALLPTGTSCSAPDSLGALVPPTAAEDSALPQLSFDGTKFHLETFGNKSNPVVVFLHGGPGLDYRGLLELRNELDGKRLEDDYFLVYWDQRGSGLSQRVDARQITLERFERDLDHIIDRFGQGRKVVLVGYSWGGMFAARYLGQHPEKVAAAVLMEPGPLTRALYDELPGELDVWGEVENDYVWSERVVTPDDHARADYQAAVARMNLSDPNFWRIGSSVSLTMQASFNAAWPEFTAGVDQFQGRVLLEATDESELGLELQRKQKDFFRDVTLHSIKNADHDFPYAEWEQALAPMFDFLQSVSFE